jgi:hypothetical protein
MKGLTGLYLILIFWNIKISAISENIDEYKKTSRTSSNPGHPDADKMQFQKI